MPRRAAQLLVALLAAALIAALALAPAQATHWPRPLPAWTWTWLEWRIGHGVYRCLPLRSAATRPTSAPRIIPLWAWERLGALLAGGAVVNPCGQEPQPPVSPPAPPALLDEREAEALRLVNAERTNVPSNVLSVSLELQRAAEDHAADMAVRGYFSHDFPPGVPFGSWIGRYWQAAAGENIALGYSTPAAVVAGWMGSPGHRSNILGSWSVTGLAAVARSDGALVWVQTFGMGP